LRVVVSEKNHLVNGYHLALVCPDRLHADGIRCGAAGVEGYVGLLLSSLNGGSWFASGTLRWRHRKPRQYS
jgi:hypothetical protein